MGHLSGKTRLTDRIKAKMLLGMAILISITLLIYLYVWLYNTLLRAPINTLFNWVSPWIDTSNPWVMVALYAVLIAICVSAVAALAVLIGAFVGTFIGRALKAVFGGLIAKVPGYRMLNRVIGNLIEGGGTRQFSRFGLAYLSEDLDGPCFPVIITGENETHFSVMTPSVPTPMSGFIYLYPRHRVKELAMTSEEFFSYVIGMGIGAVKMMENVK